MDATPAPQTPAPDADIAALIKAQDAIITDLSKQLRAAQQKRSDLQKVAVGRATAAKLGV